MDIKFALAVILLVPVFITSYFTGIGPHEAGNNHSDRSYTAPDATEPSEISNEGPEQFGSAPEEVISLPEFERVDEQVGLTYGFDFTRPGFSGFTGAYVTDYTNNGFEDVLIVDGDEAVLFRNKGGEFVRTGQLSDYSNVMAAHFFDHDNSGWPDLLLLRRNWKPIFLENRDGTFREKDIGIDTRFSKPYSAATVDYNQDGCTDLFITQWGGEKVYSYSMAKKIQENEDMQPAKKVNGHKNRFYTGNCDSFRSGPKTLEEGFHTYTGSFVDFTGDGYPDIHAANDFTRDAFYRNNGDGTFTKTVMGATSQRNAMSSTVADINNDLKPDIFVTNIYYPEHTLTRYRENLLNLGIIHAFGNNLFINTEDGFVDAAPDYGVRRGGFGWGSTVEDFSNDGHLTIVHTNSRGYEENVAKPPQKYVLTRIFERVNSTRFRSLNATRHGFVPDNGRGIVSLDYNNDGNLDILKTIQPQQENGEITRDYFKLYRNTAKSDEYIQLMLDGRGYVETNTEFYLKTDKRYQYRILDSRTGLLSQGSPVVHFGLENEEFKELIVRFPDGEELTFDDLETGKRYMINRNQKTATPVNTDNT